MPIPPSWAEFRPGFSRRLGTATLTRRDVLWLLGASASATTLAALGGCATSPVDGRSIVVGLSEDDERNTDRRLAPHQFSQDLGAVQDAGLNAYVSTLGQQLHSRSHRPGMPYSYRVLNANYVNAYTFPGGSVGITRGIVTEMQSEAELAALTGHELGHVNARHAAQRQGQAMVAQGALVGLAVALGDKPLGGVATIAGQIGASALLSSYSRDNEREADALGQEYMVRAGYPASGMVSLHQLLLSKQTRQPSVIETMFSSHPMPQERVENARQLAASTYGASASLPVQRERYMDNTARLRAIRPTIEACQAGETAVARKQLGQAETHYADAIRRTPGDYAANVLMAQCLVAQKRQADALRYAEAAKSIYPQEAQARQIAAGAKMAVRDYAGAIVDLDAYDRALPGNPGVVFLKGVALEGLGDRNGAAQHYTRFTRTVSQGDAATYANGRLKAWGYAR